MALSLLSLVPRECWASIFEPVFKMLGCHHPEQAVGLEVDRLLYGEAGVAPCSAARTRCHMISDMQCQELLALQGFDPSRFLLNPGDYGLANLLSG